MGKRTVDLVLILCLVVGVVGLSFDNCVRDCLLRSSHRGVGAGAGFDNCSKFCHMNTKVTKSCVLFWCWK